jgi:hypothetical protein
MTVERLKERRAQLVEALRETAIRQEQLRGALALCDEMLIETEGDGRDVQEQHND